MSKPLRNHYVGKVAYVVRRSGHFLLATDAGNALIERLPRGKVSVGDIVAVGNCKEISNHPIPSSESSYTKCHCDAYFNHTTGRYAQKRSEPGCGFQLLILTPLILIFVGMGYLGLSVWWLLLILPLYHKAFETMFPEYVGQTNARWKSELHTRADERSRHMDRDDSHEASELPDHEIDNNEANNATAMLCNYAAMVSLFNDELSYPNLSLFCSEANEDMPDGAYSDHEHSDDDSSDFDSDDSYSSSDDSSD